MNKLFSWLCIFGFFLLSGCGAGSQETMIRDMVEKYIQAVDKGDDIKAMECLVDYDKFVILYPDLGTETRTKALEVTDALETATGRMFNHFDGRDLVMKRFTLGSFWDQFKGRPGFHGSKVIVSADGELSELVIDKIVKIGDNWFIYDLGGLQF